MAGVTMPWGDTYTVLAEVGFVTQKFTLDDADLGRLDTGGYLDGTLLGEDISDRVRQITITRGRSDQLQEFQAGTCTLVLDNNDRAFDPVNTASPYWDAANNRSGVTLRRKVRIYANGVQIFTGRITDIDIQYEPTAAVRSEVVIDCADDFLVLASTLMDEYTPALELSSARISGILDLPEVAYPSATRDIGTGTVAVQPTTIPLGTRVLDALQLVTKAEWGYLFVSGDGDLTFRPRPANFFTVPPIFADDGTGYRYTGISVVYGQETLYNRIVITPEGGIPVTAENTTSEADFGVSTLSIDGVPLDEADAEVLAAYLLADFGEPSYRLDQLSVVFGKGDAYTSGQRAAILGLELAQNIEVKKTYAVGTPSTVVRDVTIEQVSHQITPSSHTLTFGLSQSRRVYPFTLDSSQMDSEYALY